MSTVLDRINGPEDVRALTDDELLQLAEDIRDRVVETMPINGGHFAPSLGLVDVTVALHRVFDFKDDNFVLDVSHQCYPHKMLTGRREEYSRIRLKDGPAGYTNPEESDYDRWWWAHAGSSLSTALGMARGSEDDDSWTVAIIGDSSIHTGMALEAMNHAGDVKPKKLLYILNDNDMSIAPTVGALSNHFKGIKKEHRETGAQADGEGKDAHLGRFFEALGQRYVGPHDGHDLLGLVKLFEKIKADDKSTFLHLMTVKGKGHSEAEKDPWKWHAVGGVKQPDAKPLVEFKRMGKKPYTEVTVDTFIERARIDPKLHTLTAAMSCGTGLRRFKAEFPDRFYDTGIAEQHAVAFAAGMAKAGQHMVACIYSTFLQRGFDQIFQEVSLNNVPLVICMDRAGIVGPDGATHNGCFDISYTRCFPRINIMAPADASELKDMINLSIDIREPCAIRYPRTAAPADDQEFEKSALEMGKADLMRRGSDVALLAYGSMVYPAMEAAELLEEQGVNATVVNARFVRPMDEAMLKSLLEDHSLVVTIEENTLKGGFGSACLETAAQNRWDAGKIFSIGIPDDYVIHGTRAEALESIGLLPDGIAEQIRQALTDSSQTRRIQSTAGEAEAF